MSTSTRLATFGLALAAALSGGAALGAAVGPDVTTAEEETPAPIGAGVVAVAEGYRLLPLSTDLPRDGGVFRFTVVDRDDEPVTEFTPIHERDLHLVVVNRDLTAFHHGHPSLEDDGVWSIRLPALAAGSYRAVADFHVSGGPRLALGTDLRVAGRYEPADLDEPDPVRAVDGYEVSLSTEPDDGGAVTAQLTVRQGGELVASLQPYLGAKGHLVALRHGDLLYAHVHPHEEREAIDGVVGFKAELPSAGRYGLFFDFKHEGVVHSASFTVDQGAGRGQTRTEH